MKADFIRIACLSTPVVPGNVPLNTRHIIDAVNRHPDADFLVTPEMSLTGYTCQDLFLQEHLLEKALEGLETLRRAFQKTGILIVGMPIRIHSRVFNCAVVLQGSPHAPAAVLGVVPKTWLPNYSEFYEMRWFASARDLGESTLVLKGIGDSVPVGNDLIFCCEASGLRFGVEICEDLWAVTPPSNQLALGGALLIANLSASNELVGKASYRRELVKSQSGRLIVAYAYASAGTGESVSDTVFSGHCILAENDRILAESPRLQRETAIEADICPAEIEAERNRNSTFRTQFVGSCRYIPCQLSPRIHPVLLKAVSPTPFIPNTPEARAQVCSDIVDIQSAALSRRLDHLGHPYVVIGVSGGLDSALALLVARLTFQRIGLDPAGIIGITMPGLGTSAHTKSNAHALMQGLGITSEERSIAGIAETELETLGHTAHDITFENVQARARTALLFNRANQVKGLVLGTGDLSELALGWMTYCGDSESHYHINAGIPKTLVKVIIQWLAQQDTLSPVRDVIQSILDTPISPELLPLGKEGEIVQHTESSIGPYLLHDFFLYWAIRKQLPPRCIIRLARQAFPDYTVQDLIRWLELFFTRFASQQFKRNSMPDGLKVGMMSLSPRSDWRMPSEADLESWIRETRMWITHSEE